MLKRQTKRERRNLYRKTIETFTVATHVNYNILYFSSLSRIFFFIPLVFPRWRTNLISVDVGRLIRSQSLSARANFLFLLIIIKPFESNNLHFLNRDCPFLFSFIFYNRKISINVINALINYILRNVFMK